MVQLRICLPVQGTRIWTLVWEDPTCLGAAKPVYHSYWACAPEPGNHREKPLQWEALALQEEWPLLTVTRENPFVTIKTQCSHLKKKKKSSSSRAEWKSIPAKETHRCKSPEAGQGLAGSKTKQGASQVALVVKNPPANAGDARDRGSIPWLGRSPGGRRGTLPPVLLPGKLHGQRSLADYSSWGCKESDTAE